MPSSVSGGASPLHSAAARACNAASWRCLSAQAMTDPDFGGSRVGTGFRSTVYLVDLDPDIAQFLSPDERAEAHRIELPVREQGATQSVACRASSEQGKATGCGAEPRADLGRRRFHQQDCASDRSVVAS